MINNPKEYSMIEHTDEDVSNFIKRQDDFTIALQNYKTELISAARIENIIPVNKRSPKKEKVKYVWMVLQCEESAFNDFIEKHSRVLDSKYWYSANLIARVLNQIEF